MCRPILIFGFLLFAAACSQSRSSAPNLPPSSASEKARQRISESGLQEKYAGQGLTLDCDFSCPEISDDEIELLKSYASAFGAFQKKVSHIEIGNGTAVSFSDPVGDYVMYIPAKATTDELDGIVSTFEALEQGETELGVPIFVDGTGSDDLSALHVVSAHARELRAMHLQQIVLTRGATQTSRDLRRSELNVISLVESFETVSSRLKAFAVAYQKMPQIEFAAVSNEKKIDDLLSDLIEHADQINRAIGAYQFRFELDAESGDRLIELSAWGRLWTSLHADMSIEDVVDVLGYRVKLAEYGRSIGVRLEHRDWLVSFAQSSGCFDKLLQVQSVLAAKVGKLQGHAVELDYGISDQPPVSHLDQGDLNLVCAESVDQMRHAIQDL